MDDDEADAAVVSKALHSAVGWVIVALPFLAAPDCCVCYEVWIVILFQCRLPATAAIPTLRGEVSHDATLYQVRRAPRSACASRPDNAIKHL